MRLGVLTTLMSLTIVGFAQAEDAKALVRKPVTIAAQPLELALQALAKESEIQLIYKTEIVRERVSQGATGALTSVEALEQILSGTGLTFRNLDDHTVTIVPVAASAKDEANLREAPAGRRQSMAPSRGISVAQAKSNAAPPQDKQSGEQQGEKLEEIVVTAQKRQERLKDVPISISVLNGAQLENATIISASDALTTIPGVSANKAYLSGGTLVTVRGVSTGLQLISGSSPVAYYLDSVPFALVKSAIGPDQNVYDLQRIEVLRGPQGTLYGASALNGVVRVLTNDADLNDFEVKTRTSYSSTQGGGDGYRGDFAVNVPIMEGKLAARAVVGYERLGGWIDSPVGDDVNDGRLRNYRLKVNAQPLEDLSIGVSMWSAQDDLDAPGNGGDDNTSSSLYKQPIATDFDAYALKLGYSASGYSISSMTGYLDYSSDSDTNFSALYGFPFVFSNLLDSHSFSQEILLNSPTAGGWKWSLGGMYRRATEDRYSFATLAGPVAGFFGSSDNESKSFAGFGEITRLFLNGRVEATVGLRHFEDDVGQTGRIVAAGPLLSSEGKFHATTPRAVLTLHVRDELTMYGSYSEGFRSGFPQDFSVPIGFPPVKPDKLKNYELGLKGDLWNGRLSLDMAVYFMDWQDAQQTLQVPYQNVTTTAVVNGRSASGTGMDLGLALRPMPGLRLSVSASWNDLGIDGAVFSGGNVPLFNKGDRLNYSPKTTAGASAGYEFALGGSGLMAELAASANYTSAQSFRQNPGGTVVLEGTGDSMLIGRIGVSVDSPKGWRATLFVNNVNNEDGTIVRPFLVPDLSSRIQPRTAGLQVEYRFREND